MRGFVGTQDSNGGCFVRFRLLVPALSVAERVFSAKNMEASPHFGETKSTKRCKECSLFFICSENGSLKKED